MSNIEITVNDSKRIKKELWEEESKAYNSIFNYLKKKGFSEKEMIKFSKLLIAYTKLISWYLYQIMYKKPHKKPHRYIKYVLIP